MGLFRRARSVPPPVVVPPDGRRRVAEADRENYAALGWTHHGKGALYAGPELSPGLVPMILDGLADRQRPERSGIVCGVHDADVERALARATGRRYTRAVLTVRLAGLPAAGTVSDVEAYELRAVLLFLPDGPARERRRVGRVVELAGRELAQVRTAEQVRDRLVDTALQPYGVLSWELGKAVVAAGLRGRHADRTALLDELASVDPQTAAALR